MQTDLSYGVQQEQHDTHASWLPRACLFRIFTSHSDNCDFPDILILSHCIEGLKVSLKCVMWMCYVISFIVRYSLAMSSLEIIRGLIHNTLNICDSFIHHCFKSFTMQEDLRYTCSYYEIYADFHMQTDDKNWI